MNSFRFHVAQVIGLSEEIKFNCFVFVRLRIDNDVDYEIDDDKSETQENKKTPAAKSKIKKFRIAFLLFSLRRFFFFIFFTLFVLPFESLCPFMMNSLKNNSFEMENGNYKILVFIQYIVSSTLFLIIGFNLNRNSFEF